MNKVKTFFKKLLQAISLSENALENKPAFFQFSFILYRISLFVKSKVYLLKIKNYKFEINLYYF